MLQVVRSRTLDHCEEVKRELAESAAAASKTTRHPAGETGKKRRNTVVTISVPSMAEPDKQSAEERSERRAAELRQALQHNTLMFTKATDRVVALLPPLQAVRMRPQESNVEALLVEVSEVKATRESRQLCEDPTQWDGGRPYSCLPMSNIHCFPKGSGYQRSITTRGPSATASILAQRNAKSSPQYGTLEQLEARDAKLLRKEDNGLNDAEGLDDDRTGTSGLKGASVGGDVSTATGTISTRSWEWAVQALPNQRRFISLFGRVGGVQSALDFTLKNQGRSLPFADVPEVTLSKAPHSDAETIPAPGVPMRLNRY